MGPEPEPLPPRWQSALRVGALALTLAATALLAWNCLRNPDVHFLAPGPGEWIVYPMPAELGIYPDARLAGSFRRSFVLTENPAAASLAWRCFTNGEVFVNNILIPFPDAARQNWKVAARVEVAPLLHQGTNEILVVVTNQLGPPALSLELKSENFLLESDENWAVSVSGSNWRPAVAASATPALPKIGALRGLEQTPGALRQCWPWLCLFAAMSACATALFQFYLRQRATSLKIILAAMAFTWLLLFLHNFPFVPASAGFDGPDHLTYISYIQDHHQLPDAREGWEMFQPPLYYWVSAKLLDLAHCRAFELSGMMLLHWLSLAIGAANLALLFFGLRLLFPGDWKKPLAGLLLAAFFPAQIGLLHYTTNETLAALFVTAALCAGLKILREERPHWGWFVALGLALGLAIMSKASALVAVPALLGVMALKLALRRERSPKAWLLGTAVPLGLCLLVGGWHYLRLWREYGSPLIGNWDAKIALPWWQAKGYETPGYYLAFGHSLVEPFFGGLHGFWDGLYSTLWGDGLLGGTADVWSRPPWNYQPMAAGYLLALVPLVLVLTGLWRTVKDCWREARLPWVLCLGFGWIFAFAILHMSLKVPSYAQTKAFYGLPLLLPFCALGALGLEFWTRRPMTRHVILIALGIWMINVYASFWIHPDTDQSRLSWAIGLRQHSKEDAVETLQNLLKQYPHDSQASIHLAAVELKLHRDQSIKRLEQALGDDPDNPQIETALAWSMSFGERIEEAIGHARRAISLEPENREAYETWCALALRQRHYADAVQAGRITLSLNPTDLKTHFNVGMALMSLGQIQDAGDQFSIVISAQPEWAEAQFCLGRCLVAEPGRREEGIRHLREAVKLQPGWADWQAALTKALKGL